MTPVLVVLALAAQAEAPFRWPPANVAPLVTPAEAGEGVFRPVGDAIRAEKGADPPVLQATLRTRLGRAGQAVLVAWDPRRVELRMQAGSRNPVPPKGPRGSGRLPADGALARRLLGAFNGGFLTEDVKCCDGMIVDGHTLTPPTPKGSTVALLTDGRTAFGTWPAGEVTPTDVVSLRQNLQPFMEGGALDPLKRKRWGGTVDVTYADGDRTVRTALCAIDNGALVFAYLSFADPALLGEVLRRVGCSYAIHLDMNPGHATFEYYRPLGAGEAARDPKAVVDVGGVAVEATPAVEKLRKVGFPRYLGRSSSDFFYLVERPGALARPVVPLFGR